jgi:hypothetical protein
MAKKKKRNGFKPKKGNRFKCPDCEHTCKTKQGVVEHGVSRHGRKSYGWSTEIIDRSKGKKKAAIKKKQVPEVQYMDVPCVIRVPIYVGKVELLGV